MLWIALAVLVGFGILVLVLDLRLTQFVREIGRIRVLLARDIEERSEERVTRLEHEIREPL